MFPEVAKKRINQESRVCLKSHEKDKSVAASACVKSQGKDQSVASKPCLTSQEKDQTGSERSIKTMFEVARESLRSS